MDPFFYLDSVPTTCTTKQRDRSLSPLERLSSQGMGHVRGFGNRSAGSARRGRRGHLPGVLFPAALDGNWDVDRGACQFCSIRRRPCGESWSESLQFSCNRTGGESDFGRSLRGHWTPLGADRIACGMELCRGCTVWNVGLRWTGERGAQPWNAPGTHNFDRRRVWTGGMDRGAVVFGGRRDSPLAYGTPGSIPCGGVARRLRRPWLLGSARANVR